MDRLFGNRKPLFSMSSFYALWILCVPSLYRDWEPSGHSVCHSIYPTWASRIRLYCIPVHTVPRVTIKTQDGSYYTGLYIVHRMRTTIIIISEYHRSTLSRSSLLISLAVAGDSPGGPLFGCSISVKAKRIKLLYEISPFIFSLGQWLSLYIYHTQSMISRQN